MKTRALVADDSLTIQKVISITLANESVDIDQCNTEQEAVSKLDEKQYDIVLLDYNLSEKLDGYELTKSIKEKLTNSGLFVLLGTFDSVNEDQLLEHGADDLIVKPFESSKFLNKFRTIVKKYKSDDEVSEEVEDLIEAKKEEVSLDIPMDDSTPFHEELDSWTTNAPEITPTETVSSFSLDELEPLETTSGNDLESAALDWGIELPGKIEVMGGDSFDDQRMELPPKIQSETIETFSELNEVEAQVETGVETKIDLTEEALVMNEAEEDSDIKYPESSDLDYPDLGLETISEDSPTEIVEKEMTEISLDSLPDSTTDDIQLEDLSHVKASDRRPVFTSADELTLAPLEDYSFEEETKENIDRSDLERAVEADLDPESFWEIDKDSSSVSFSGSLSEEKETISPGPEERPEVHQSLGEAKDLSSFDVSGMRDEIMLQVEKIIKEQCQEAIEKVVWEVVPEIAERLIQKEIDSVKASQSQKQL
ncbi:MAG: response regulator [Bacteriovoracaceae bacterium]